MAKSKKTRAEEYAELPIEDITRTKATKEGIGQLVKIVSVMRQGYHRRMTAIERANEYSYAGDKYSREQSDDPTIRSKVNELIKTGTEGSGYATARNWLIHEFARYQAFYESKTSSLTGIREVNREQDIRIFGKNEAGEPLGTLTLGERRVYWALYNDFASGQHAAEVSNRGSKVVQRDFGQFIRSGKISIPINWISERASGDLPRRDLMSFLSKMGYDISKEELM